MAFLEVTGYCQIWVLGYGLDAKPLYELLKQTTETGSLNGGNIEEQAFQTLKKNY